MLMSLTRANNRREARQKDDPVILGPEQPTAVYEDKFAKEIRERDEDVGAHEDARLVREPINARRGLRGHIRTAPTFMQCEVRTRTLEK